MKFSSFLLLCLSLIFSACAPGIQQDRSGGDPPFGQNDKTSQDITDRSSCKGKAEEVPIYAKSWKTKVLVKNGVVLTQEISFTPHQIEINLNGRYLHQSKTIFVRSDIRLEEDLFKVYTSAHARETLLVEGETYELAVYLQPKTYKYSFVGPCLRLEDNDGKFIVLVDSL